jgi:hypothetical protein
MYAMNACTFITMPNLTKVQLYLFLYVDLKTTVMFRLLYNSNLLRESYFSHAIKPLFTHALEGVSKYRYPWKLSKLLILVRKIV